MTIDLYNNPIITQTTVNKVTEKAIKEFDDYDSFYNGNISKKKAQAMIKKLNLSVLEAIALWVELFYAKSNYSLRVGLKKYAIKNAKNLLEWLVIYEFFPQERKESYQTLLQIIHQQNRFSKKELSAMKYSTPFNALAYYIDQKQK